MHGDAAHVFFAELDLASMHADTHRHADIARRGGNGARNEWRAPVRRKWRGSRRPAS